VSITIVGNVTKEPDALKYTAGGKALLRISVAQSKKKGDERVTYFFDVTCWEKVAENVAQCIKKGDRVIVHGDIDPQEWVDKEGVTQRRVGVNARYVGADLPFDTVTIHKVERTQASRPAAAETPAYEEPF